MSSKAAYLEHYLESLQALPIELQRNFSLLRELDTQAFDKIKSADELATEYLKNVGSMTREGRKEGTGSVRNLFKKALDISDDKVQLAMQTYELVDKHIRRLDADLARFEADLKDTALNPQALEADLIQKKKGRKTGDKKVGNSDDDLPKAVKKKLKQQAAAVQAEITPLPISLSIAHASDVLDMPVDPNEPTYCFCHQVSYGEMIGCDNPDCSIEWFHFACVGLTTKPKGKWYCSNCFTEKKKK